MSGEVGHGEYCKTVVLDALAEDGSNGLVLKVVELVAVVEVVE